MKRFLSTFLYYGIDGNAITVDTGLALLRIIAGLAFAMIFEKVLPREGVWGPQQWFIDDVTSMGFPAPIFFAWVAVLSEFIGGIFLVLGLATRSAAFMTAVVTFVALFFYHGGDVSQSGLTSLVFMVMSTTLLIAGPGRFSIDGLLAGKRTKALDS